MIGNMMRVMIKVPMLFHRDSRCANHEMESMILKLKLNFLLSFHLKLYLQLRWRVND